jgi:ABC-type nitrate/sulfonate/bicarbonate transport system substrate-binding protein
MSSVVLTLWAAQDKGFFARNNVDAQLVFIPGSPTLIASLNTGDVHFGFTGGTATLGAAVAGLDVRMIAAFANRVQSELVTRPEIKTAAELRGKRVGVTSIGGTGWMSALLILEQIGINAERDKMQLTAFGDQRVISQALESGTIQGAALAGVFSRKLARAVTGFRANPIKFHSRERGWWSRPIIFTIKQRSAETSCVVWSKGTLTY